jgi:hypothetical protein
MVTTPMTVTVEELMYRLRSIFGFVRANTYHLMENVDWVLVDKTF